MVYFRPYSDTASSRNIPGELKPGKVDPTYFRLLMGVTSQRSVPLLRALEDVLVRGVPRKDVCALYGVNAGNLSTKLSRLQVISQTIARMYPCQFDRSDCPVSRHLLLQEKAL
ncbi:PapB/FocB family fimbrial expression transcriptional regulator [Citrobacter meridianamericanus]|uniref:PapB/FocB family fimbrial expression transcriptional regulator n=1 Tax=Citrobacter meridianamericanus TaxID=2894201 RepID=UPI0039BE59E3